MPKGHNTLPSYRFFFLVALLFLTSCGRVPAAAPPVTPPPAPSVVTVGDRVRADYIALVLLKGSAVMLDETATQVQHGQLVGGAALGRLLGISAVLRSVEEQLARDASVPALVPAWDAARNIAPRVRVIFAAWAAEDITAADVPARLAPEQEHLDRMLALAETSLAREYGSLSELPRVREAALATLRANLQATPTPVP
jgi:hypothetical protein